MSSDHTDRRAYRLSAIDMLRGLVIVIMAIDHARDNFLFGRYMDGIFELIRGQGYYIRKVPYMQWLAVIDRQAEKNALFPLLFTFRHKVHAGQTLMELYQNTAHYDCRNVLSGLAGSDIACPSIDQSIMSRYLERLASSGLLSLKEAPSSNADRRTIHSDRFEDKEVLCEC